MRHVTKVLSLVAAALLLASCSDFATTSPEGWSVEDDGAQSDSAPASETPPESETTANDDPTRTEQDHGSDRFVVHEWGTFTSLQTSDGHNLEGLHHEAEALPPFVHDMAYEGVDESGAAQSKGMMFLPGPVTQKLETPVIYFYGEPDSAQVDVRFPNGLISQWYPQNTEYAPGGLPEQVGDGFMSWDVELSSDADLIEVPEEDIWAPSRQVPEARFVTNGRDSDKFIFYRGVGRFEMPFEVTMDARGRYRLANTSAQKIPHVFVLEVKEETGHIYEVGGLEGFSEDTFMPAPKEMPKPISTMVDEAKTKVSGALVDTGLTRAEANAMVETWERSYFKKPGHRILYIVPRTWTDELLPIDITPRPDELVRTLVGRIDILPPSEEQVMVERVERSFEEQRDSIVLDVSDRFLEPRVRAACRDIERNRDNPELANWCDRLADTLAFQVRSPVQNR